MRVVLAEKPSVARELASFLGATQPKRPFGVEQGVPSIKGANPQAGQWVGDQGAVQESHNRDMCSNCVSQTGSGETGRWVRAKSKTTDAL
jgi:hypothetical protein